MIVALISRVAVASNLFSLRFVSERERKEMMPLMEVLCTIWQAVVETYTALAADPSLVIAAAQAVLRLFDHLVKHIKEETAPEPH